MPVLHKLRHHLLLQTGNQASRLLCRRLKADDLAWLQFEIQKQLLGPLQAVRGMLWAAATSKAMAPMMHAKQPG